MPSIHPAALERGAQTAGAGSLDPAARPPPLPGVRALPGARDFGDDGTGTARGCSPGLRWGWGKARGGDPGVWGWPAWATGALLWSESHASWQ